MKTAPSNQAGFTLIEVMIAIVLLAIVSLIAWRALDNVTRTSEHLDHNTEETRSILRALQQFELDVQLRTTVELPPAGQNGSAPATATGGQPTPTRLLPDAFTTTRQAQVPFRIEIIRTAPGLPGRWQRVYWYREQNRLYRAAAAASDRFPLPAPGSSNAIAVLDNVTDFDVRAWRPGGGWTRLPAPSASSPSSGLELTIAQQTPRGTASYREVLPLR